MPFTIIKQSNQTKLKISLISLCGLNIERFPFELGEPSAFSYSQIFSTLFESIWIHNDALNRTWAAITTILKSTFLLNFVFVGHQGCGKLPFWELFLSFLRNIFLIVFGTAMGPSTGPGQLSQQYWNLPSCQVSCLSDFMGTRYRRSNRALFWSEKKSSSTVITQTIWLTLISSGSNFYLIFCTYNKAVNANTETN